TSLQITLSYNSSSHSSAFATFHQMSSLLFQSNGKSSGSSSSTSAANPFMNLAHFYEQELTDQHTSPYSSSSNSSSRQYRQQNHGQHSIGKQPVTMAYQHLFPTSSSMSFSTPSSSLFPATNSSASTNYTQNDVSYTQVQDEFNHFSQSPSQDHHKETNVDDISEYLKQRQEYYLREAMIRGRDRKDGLGPIVDFSQHISSLVENGQYSPAVKSRLEDHLEARHHNPYADKHRFFKGARASSQKEQVLMDMNHGAIEDLEGGLDLAWQESLLASDSTAMSANGSTMTGYFKEPIGDSSSSKMAGKGISYGDNGHQNHIVELINGNLDSQLQGHAEAMNNDWAEEFERSALATSQHRADQNLPLSIGRRDSLKTCGFMLDPKNNHDLDYSDLATLLSITTSANTSVSGTYQHYGDQSAPPQYHQTNIPVSMHSASEPVIVTREVYNDDVFEGDMLQAWMETLAQEKQEADERAKEHNQRPNPVATATQEIYNDDGLDGDMLQAWMQSLEQERQEADEHIEERIEKTAPESIELEMDREVYNDDVFEGGMLQSWMETLALEKQEADERAKENEEEGESEERLLDETEQKLVLEMALRRLNGLMHQLGRNKIF
ncbi:hypothetical protein BGX27_002415, partial [Mortierella sp. AM989]